MLEKRLEDAIHRWQVLAATCRILDVIRDTYQQHRQPETLQEASGYLDRLTQGRYRRVWTPLGEHALRVDDAEGHALPVEVAQPRHAGAALPESAAGVGEFLRPARCAAAAGARRRVGELRRRSGEGRRRRVARLRRRRPSTAGVHLPRTHSQTVQVAESAGQPAAQQRRAWPGGHFVAGPR